MRNYIDLLKKISSTAPAKSDRTGTGTVSLFGEQLRFDLRKGFPLLTTKLVHWPSVVHELLWMLQGDTNLRYLHEHGVSIWDEWADENGDLGPVYGAQWRAWRTPGNWAIDQLTRLVQTLKTTPDSRRMVVSAWNPADLPDETMSPSQNASNDRMALAPCHCLFQCYVSEGHLSLQMYQRSADLVLGVPFNIASYALLTRMLAQQAGYFAHELIITFGDVHIYRDHLTPEIVYTQLERKPKPLPLLRIKRIPESLFDYKFEDFELSGYDPHPPIKAPISI
jgi:thymidylate synthase